MLMSIVDNISNLFSFSAFQFRQRGTVSDARVVDFQQSYLATSSCYFVRLWFLLVLRLGVESHTLTYLIFIILRSGVIGTGAFAGSGVHHALDKPISVCGSHVQLPPESDELPVEPAYASWKHALREGPSSEFWWPAVSEIALHCQCAKVASYIPMASWEQPVLSQCGMARRLGAGMGPR